MENDSNTSKKRCPRTSKKQIEIIINYFHDNQIMLKSKLSLKDQSTLQKKWEELSQILNNCGKGPITTISQWKKAFAELKGNTKKCARQVYLSWHATGGGPSKLKELSDLEEKLLGLLSKVTVEGADIPEAGLSTDTNFESVNDVLTIELEECNDGINSHQSLLTPHNNLLLSPQNTLLSPQNTLLSPQNKLLSPETPNRKGQRRLEATIARQQKSSDYLADTIANLSATLDRQNETNKLLSEAILKLATAVESKK